MLSGFGNHHVNVDSSVGGSSLRSGFSTGFGSKNSTSGPSFGTRNDVGSQNSFISNFSYVNPNPNQGHRSNGIRGNNNFGERNVNASSAPPFNRQVGFGTPKQETPSFGWKQFDEKFNNQEVGGGDASTELAEQANQQAEESKTVVDVPEQDVVEEEKPSPVIETPMHADLGSDGQVDELMFEEPKQADSMIDAKNIEEEELMQNNVEEKSTQASSTSVIMDGDKLNTNEFIRKFFDDYSKGTFEPFKFKVGEKFVNVSQKTMLV